MSTPWAYSDECDERLYEGDEEKMQQIWEEQQFPKVIHGIYCYTEQKPNDDGNNKKGINRYRVPKLHMFTGNSKKTMTMNEVMKGKGRKKAVVEIVFHDEFEDYMDAFQSESAKNKPAPPKPATNMVTSMPI